MKTYQEYLKSEDFLTIEQMEEIHQQISDEIASDELAEELYEELVTNSIRYATVRAKWSLWDQETRMKEDSSRTMFHNAVITSFDVLARYLKKQGKAALWREKLGNLDAEPRKRRIIGDMACYLNFVHGIGS